MKVLGLALGTAIALTAGTASAEIIIDQEQNDNSVFMAAFAQTDLAQSFQTQAFDNIAGAGIFLQPNVGGTDNVTIELWDALPPDGGNLLASASAQGTQGQWVDVFWDPESIAPNTTYYLVFTGNTTLGISGSVNNPYPFGNVFANPGYQSFPNFDYTFRTWASTPAPGVLALLGIAGLVRSRRR